MFNLKKLNLNFELKFYRIAIYFFKNHRNHNLHYECNMIL